MTTLLLTIPLLVCVAPLAASLWYLRRDTLADYDGIYGQRFNHDPDASPMLRRAEDSLRVAGKAMRGVPPKQRLAAVRQALDEMFASRAIDAGVRPVAAGSVPAQWVLAPGAKASDRILYIHGGGFFVGSMQSHRTITSKLSAVTGCAVLAIDYRLMPEHKRQDGIDDVRSAYQWMLQHGPDAAAEQTARTVFVAGDSAGGNLTLALLLWLRDQKLRAPNAAVALSPVTDMDFQSPSLLSNIPTDKILGPLVRQLKRVPRLIMFWLTLYQSRMLPRNPYLSPAHGDLSGLPPILIHASETEVLLDDARRFSAKAIAAGSPVTLQTWPGLMHVWHIFTPDLPQAEHAFDEIGRFFRKHC